MPVAGPATILMLNYNIIPVLPVFAVPAATIPIFLYPYHHSISCSTYLGTSFHFKIQCSPFFMGEMAEITLDQEIFLSFFKWKVIYITCIILQLTFLKEFYSFS